MSSVRMMILLFVSACSGAHGSQPGTVTPEEEMIASAGRGGQADPESAFGPLRVGVDYARFRRVTEDPFLSAAHGDRWVHVYVNQIGADAYVGGSAVPVGTIVVKVSWLDDGGKPSQVPGPIYVMEKRAPGYFADHDDWYYAIHWAHPNGKLGAGGPIYWRGKSPRVAFCYDGCHDNYDRKLGGLTPSSLLPR